MSFRRSVWLGAPGWVAAGVMMLCLGGCDDGSADSRGTGGAGVTATGFAARLGIATYDVEVSLEPESLAVIDVQGADGSSFGTVTVSLEPAGSLVAEYVGHDGSTASMTLLGTDSADGTRVASIETLEAAGRSLTTVTVAEAEDGELVSVSLEALLTDGQPASALGGVSFRGDGTYAVLDLMEGDTHLVSEEVYGQWLYDLGLAALMSSPEATLLAALMEDPALIGELTTSLAMLAPDATSQKRSATFCEDLRQRLREQRALNIPECQQCGQIDPALASPYPLGLDTPETARRYIGACRKCGGKILGFREMPRAALCVDQWIDVQGDISSACHGRPDPWSVWVYYPDTYECQLRCDPDLCDQSCAAQHSDEFGGQCLHQTGGRPSCSCELRDADALCREAFGNAYCGGGSRVPQTDAEGNEYQVVACETAECGDTEVNGACGGRPAETCDPSAHQEGCGGPGMRCVDCFQPCEPCECDPFAQDCPENQFCDGNCSCQPTTCRWSLVAGMVPSGSRYCDPAASDASGANGLCSDNQICRPDTCQCETLAPPVVEPDDTPDAGPEPGFGGSCSILVENNDGDTVLAQCTELSGTLPQGGVTCDGVWSDVERCPARSIGLCSSTMAGLTTDIYIYFVALGDDTCEEQSAQFREACAFYPNGVFSGGC